MLVLGAEGEEEETPAPKVNLTGDEADEPVGVRLLVVLLLVVVLSAVVGQACFRRCCCCCCCCCGAFEGSIFGCCSEKKPAWLCLCTVCIVCCCDKREVVRFSKYRI